MNRSDSFMSDKEGLVRPLAAALSAAGLSVWYDDQILQVGDNLRRSIDVRE